MATIAAAGLDAVGFTSEPSRWSAAERARAKRLLRAAGLEVACVAGTPGAPGGRVSMVDRAGQDDLLDEVRRNVELARELDAPALLLLTGDALPDRPRVAQHAQLLEAARRCAQLVEGTGITFLLEPLNDRDHPGYYLTDWDEGIEVVRAVDVPHLRLAADVYHQQVQRGDALDRLRRRWPVQGSSTSRTPRGAASPAPATSTGTRSPPCSTPGGGTDVAFEFLLSDTPAESLRRAVRAIRRARP